MGVGTLRRRYSTEIAQEAPKPVKVEEPKVEIIEEAVEVEEKPVKASPKTSK